MYYAQWRGEDMTKLQSKFIIFSILLMQYACSIRTYSAVLEHSVQCLEHAVQC